MKYNNKINKDSKSPNFDFISLKISLISLKRKLLANFLVLNILTNSISYSSRALFTQNLNYFDYLLSSFDTEEELQAKDFLKVSDTIFFQSIYNYAHSLIQSLIDYKTEQEFIMMSEVVQNRENLTSEQLDGLLNYICDLDNNCNIYATSKLEALSYLYNTPNRTTQEKIYVVMFRENLTFKEVNEICAGIRAECGNNYDEAYRGASVLYNRTHCITYVEEFGASYYDQFTAPGQFQVYSCDKYQAYLEMFWLESHQGALDMFYSGEPSVDYLNFQASDNGYAVQFIKNGNWYYNSLNDEDRIDDTVRLTYSQNSN